ncbi:MAG: hypothetical protein RJQ14_23470 [Marinoscillum sp.]
MNRIFNRMVTVPRMDVIQYSKLEKIQRLNALMADTMIQFDMPGLEDSDSLEYFPLDTMGLHFVDLNGDDQHDLIYSGQSGNSGVQRTKIFYRNNDSLLFKKELPGRLVSMEQIGSEELSFFTVSNPCCDSYTAQIIKYSHRGSILNRDYTVSIVGEIKTNGMPSIDDRPAKSLPSLDLYADQFDFRSTSTYFGERTNEIHAVLRTGKMVRMLSLDYPVLVEILYTKTIDEQKWHLVLTESLNNVPPSLYEWSAGDHMRFIGWTKF